MIIWINGEKLDLKVLLEWLLSFIMVQIFFDQMRFYSIMDDWMLNLWTLHFNFLFWTHNRMHKKNYKDIELNDGTKRLMDKKLFLIGKELGSQNNFQNMGSIEQ